MSDLNEQALSPRGRFDIRVEWLYHNHTDCLEARKHSFQKQRDVAFDLAVAEIRAALPPTTGNPCCKGCGAYVGVPADGGHFCALPPTTPPETPPDRCAYCGNPRAAHKDAGATGPDAEPHSFEPPTPTVPPSREAVVRALNEMEDAVVEWAQHSEALSARTLNARAALMALIFPTTPSDTEGSEDAG